MPKAPVRIFATPDAIGDELASRLLSRIERARRTSRRFLLGSPTGRSPKPLFAAMARRLAESPQDLSHLVFVMMDEYLVRAGTGLRKRQNPQPVRLQELTQECKTKANFRR